MAVFQEVFMLCVISLSFVAADVEFHSFESHYGDEVVARDDLKVDKDKQYMEIAITPVKGNIIPTVNLHDFAMGFTAIKDDARETCYVLKLEHTLQEMLDTFQTSIKREGSFDVQKSFTCTNKRLVDDVEITMYGQRIAKFCEDYQIVETDRKFIDRPTRSIRMLSGQAIFCGICKAWLC